MDGPEVAKKKKKGEKKKAHNEHNTLLFQSKNSTNDQVKYTKNQL